MNSFLTVHNDAGNDRVEELRDLLQDERLPGFVRDDVLPALSDKREALLWDRDPVSPPCTKWCSDPVPPPWVRGPVSGAVESDFFPLGSSQPISTRP